MIEEISAVSNKKFYTAKYDAVFKAIFVDPKNPMLLEGLLEDILHTNVKIIKFYNTELNVNRKNERNKRIDTLVEAEGKYIHIELNTDTSLSKDLRNFIYFEAIHAFHAKNNEEYDKVNEYIHIDLSFGLGNNHDYIEEYTINNKKGGKEYREYINNYKLLVVNMDKIKKFCYDKNKKGIKEYPHLGLIDLNEEELEAIENKDGYTKEYMKKVIELNCEDGFVFDFITKEEDERWLRNAYKQDGIEEGIEQNKIDVAKKMLAKNKSIDEIAELTDLTIEEINALNINNY